MGMYTELIFGASLHENTPSEVIETLRYMIGDIEKPKNLLFDSERNPLLGSSYYFGVNEPVNKMWFDDIDKCWHISTRCNIKNYDQDIQNFLKWIEPHIDSGSGNKDMYAIVIYEGSSEPKIYYKNND